MLGELAAGPCMFEVFRNTPGLRHMRDCLRKQLAWHHELERRTRTAPDRIEAPPASRNEVPFPWLIVVSTGRPETVLEGVTLGLGSSTRSRAGLRRRVARGEPVAGARAAVAAEDEPGRRGVSVA
ncbi:hypothetical protein BE20_38750 [Sorangium cellulosum]|nr:hypothetical protein BE20_38750 [Sorangium cellulosum]